MLDAIVIGGGQAGLAMGRRLQEAGLIFQILEARATAGGSWPSYYDSLELFSPARYSALPGLPFPGDPERYPRRDEVTAYLQGYAQHFALPLDCGRRAMQVWRQNGHWNLRLADGETRQARSLIAASGGFGRPNRPDFPGQAEFLATGGRVLHSADYRRPQDFSGQRVIVVGAGNSAVQIAHELREHAQTTLSSREPVRFLPQRPLGRDIHDWFTATGYDHAPLGQWFGLRTPVRVLDTGRYRAALRQGTLPWRPLFTRYAGRGVEWADGSHSDIDAVILATGFHADLGYLSNSAALSGDGKPLQRGGVSTTLPGLYYLGLEWQRAFASATLRGVGRDAQFVLRHLRRHLRQS